MDYSLQTCMGCDVHAKLIIMQKLDVTPERGLYHWKIGTRRLTTNESIDACLQIMNEMNGTWATFSRWILKNRNEFDLWFPLFNKIPNTLFLTLPSSTITFRNL